ncbi:MAG: phosphatidate cytidylyltransferase [Aquificaceae bacterium]|nr:phosphatidate cytidylyltransferase [Aquificaceae bacterium]
MLSFLIGFEVSKAVNLRFYHLAPVTFLLASLSHEIGLVALLLLSLYVGWKGWNFTDFTKALLICLYAGFLPVFLLDLRELERYALLKLLFFVWAVDVFSYYTGRSLGRRLMAPKLSPKKTWEGFLGGALAGFFVLVVLHGIKGVLLSPVLIAGAVFGDLFKSFIKRQVGIKDFSSALGEHGGFTDRFDSLIFSAPLYLFFLKFWIWTE